MNEGWPCHRLKETRSYIIHFKGQEKNAHQCTVARHRWATNGFYPLGGKLIPYQLCFQGSRIKVAPQVLADSRRLMEKSLAGDSQKFYIDSRYVSKKKMAPGREGTRRQAHKKGVTKASFHKFKIMSSTNKTAHCLRIQ